LDQKQKTPIGKAYIDPRICIPWSGRGECIVCEEMCPLPEKAIVLEETTSQDESGEVRILQAPVVLHDRCIGCGLCENKCPVNGEAAIRVMVDPMS
jgi:NAD-dependent dihydropyrimidine dehydrogenase PreA subunit